MELETSLAKFYQGKSVLVTGHTGFKGGWLATWLKMMGSKVNGIALPPKDKTPNLFSSAQVAKGMSSHFADIRDFNLVKTLFRKCKPEIVIHNAAQALVLQSYANPLETYATNVMGTAHILEAARQTTSVRALVVVTSDKCYENREWIWGYREHDPLGGRDPYSSSKACAELLTAAYRQSFFTENASLGVASARAGNVIGGGDWANDRLVPDLIRGILRRTKIHIRNPKAVRPWQHVLDPLHGYLMLGQRLWNNESDFACAWNFGPKEGIASVGSIAKRIINLWGDGELKIASHNPDLHEAHYLMLDSSRAQICLGWRPLLSLDEALEWTVEWYRSCASGSNREDMTHNQIQRYSERI